MVDFLHLVKLAITVLISGALSFFSSPSLQETPPRALTEETPTTTISISTKTPGIVTQSTAERSDDSKKPEQQKEVGVQTTASPLLPESPKPAEIPTPPAVTDSAPTAWNDINERARAATVNILCMSNATGPFNPVSGSGVIVSPTGIILINAHLAQYLVVKDYPLEDSIECLIRQGSPASPRYIAKLIYISPAWVLEHNQDILIQEARGTGENDFAFLSIEKLANHNALFQEEFPFLPIVLANDASIVGNPILITAYPAGFLGGLTIQMSLFLSSAPATIQDVYTFTDTTIDLVSLGGTVVSQQGSSGGAVVNSEGKLLGIVVTSSEEPTTSERDLRAITISHIDRVLRKEANISLVDFLKKDPRKIGEEFSRDTLPELEELYTHMLKKASR